MNWQIFDLSSKVNFTDIWWHDVVILCVCVCVRSRSTLAGFWTQMFSTSGWTRKTIVWMRGTFQSFFASAFTSETTRFVWSCRRSGGMKGAVFSIINTQILQSSGGKWRQLWTLRLSFSECEESWSETLSFSPPSTLRCRTPNPPPPKREGARPLLPPLKAERREKRGKKLKF